MSIYRKVMGEDFLRLHPMLQKRYELQFFHANGIMQKIQSGPRFLFPLILVGARRKLLFPEYGQNIPFEITNTARIGPNGDAQVHWERIFYFAKKKRYFNALMSLDAKRFIIKDYLGEPSIVYSDLVLEATPDGHLRIESKNQRLVLGRVEIPLPTFLQGLASVTEKYIDDKGVFQIDVIVKNPLVGTIFAYEGEFIANDIS